MRGTGYDLKPRAGDSLGQAAHKFGRRGAILIPNHNESGHGYYRSVS